MLPLDVLYRLLDGLRGEAIQAVERPSDEDKNAFGFGRVAGMFYVIEEMRLRIDMIIAESNQQEDERG